MKKSKMQEILRKNGIHSICGWNNSVNIYTYCSKVPAYLNIGHTNDFGEKICRIDLDKMELIPMIPIRLMMEYQRVIYDRVLQVVGRYF